MFIQPAIDEPLAQQRLTKQRFKRIRQMTGAILNIPYRALTALKPNPPDKSPRRPLPYMELVWLPYFRVTIETKRKGRTESVDALIGGHDAGFTIFDWATTRPDPSDKHQTFDPDIDEAKAEHVARQGLVRFIMRSPGWGAKPTIGKTKAVMLIQYPFWVYYFERRRGKIDVKLLDALTGQHAGAKAKVAFLAAITAEDNSP